MWQESCHAMLFVTILCWQFFGFTSFFLFHFIDVVFVVVSFASEKMSHSISVGIVFKTKIQKHNHIHGYRHTIRRTLNFNGIGHIFQLCKLSTKQFSVCCWVNFTSFAPSVWMGWKGGRAYLLAFMYKCLDEWVFVPKTMCKASKCNKEVKWSMFAVQNIATFDMCYSLGSRNDQLKDRLRHWFAFAIFASFTQIFHFIFTSYSHRALSVCVRTN